MATKIGKMDVQPMKPAVAAFFRRVCTELGIPDGCPLKPCRRQRRCATAQVLCYQALREPINALVLPALRAPGRRRSAARMERIEGGLRGGCSTAGGPTPATPDKMEPG